MRHLAVAAPLFRGAYARRQSAVTTLGRRAFLPASIQQQTPLVPAAVARSVYSEVRVWLGAELPARQAATKSDSYQTNPNQTYQTDIKNRCCFGFSDPDQAKSNQIRLNQTSAPVLDKFS